MVMLLVGFKRLVGAKMLIERVVGQLLAKSMPSLFPNYFVF
jgi:hypothetical protein